MIVSWRIVALSSSLVATAAIAGLIVVVALGDADALSSVALSLAILAFVIQILVFIAQAWTSGQQMVQSTELNAQTLSLLSEVKTRAASAETILVRQADQAMALVQSLIGQRKEGDGLDIDQAVQQSQQVTEPASPSLSAEARERLNRLLAYPAPEDPSASFVQEFVDMSPLAAATLRLLADDERDSIRFGVEPGVRAKGADSPGVVELIERGILEWAPDLVKPEVLDDSGRPAKWVRLTDKGREVARFVLGHGTIPDYLREALAARAGSSD